MQLMVLGMHRSGTSVLARILNLMGVYFGPEGASTGANRENPKGFWERRDVRDLNDMVLWSAGCDWNRVLEFDIAAVPAPVLADFNKRAARVVLEMDAHRPWLLKEPRLCLLLPLWLRLLEVPVCIHIVRHPVEVAASLRTRNQMPMDAGLALWERYVRSAWQESAGLPGLVVSHRELMEDPRGATSRLFAGLQAAGVANLRMPTDREIDAFVRDDLYREREDRADLAEYASAPQIRIFKSVVDGRGLPASPASGQMSARSRKALARYESGLPPVPAPRAAEPPMPQSERVLHEKLALKTQEAQLVRELATNSATQLERTDERQARLERDLDLARGESARLLQDIQARDRRIAELDAALQSAKEASTGLTRDVEARDRQVAELDAALRSAEATSARLSQDAKARDGRVAEIEAELQSAQGELVRLSDELLERDARLASLTEASERLSEDLARSEQDRASLRQQAAELADEAKAANDARFAAETNVSERFGEIEALTRLLVEREKAVGSAHARARELDAALAEAEAGRAAEATRYAAEKARSATEKARLLRDVRAHAAAREKARLEIGRLREEREALRRQVGLLTLSSASLGQQVEDLVRKLQRVRADIGWRATAPLRILRRKLAGRISEPSGVAGALDEIRLSGLFDVQWYRQEYPDVAESGMDPAEHYLRHGACEGRDPGPAFDTGYYLSRNADVAETGMNPLLHYVRHGKDEGRGTGRGENSNG